MRSKMQVQVRARTAVMGSIFTFFSVAMAVVFVAVLH